jgi:hypothetical protein
MQHATTAGADLRVDLDPDFFAGQMIGEGLASRLSISRSDARFLCGFSTRYVGLDVLQSECELVGIDALRPAAKPRTLKLFDDQLESVDLTLVLLDDGRHVAHKAMQQGRVRRKIVEIELLVESYAGALIQSSNFVIFHAGFRILSTRERRLSGALRCAAVKAFDRSCMLMPLLVRLTDSQVKLVDAVAS